MVITDNTILKRSPIMSVPVVRLGGNGVVLSFNLKSGDLGWIKANDRDISLFKQSFKESIPDTARFHSFSDAVFIPDNMAGVTINSSHTGDAVLQTSDGTSCVTAFMTANCVIECDSTTKAFSVPRMTTAQRNAISVHRDMIVYVIDSSPPKFTDGTGWS